jgi:ABC-2 type transport system ATP-binding protein
VISVNNISKSFGNIQAVKELTFKVSDGEILGLLGPNGAGKSTTMRMMSGFLSPDKGDVSIDDVSVLENPIQAQEMLGYLPENNPLYKDMLVSELLDFSAELKHLYGAEKNEALDFVVNSVGISEVYYRPVNELSKGYRQRVGIALALLHKPKVLIMDEPTEGLDPNQRSEIRTLIKNLSKNHTIVISTHVMQEVEALCSRMVIISKGEKVADGSVDELTHSARNEKVLLLELEGAGIEESLKKLANVKSLKVGKKSKTIFEATITTDSKVSLQPEISKLVKAHDWTIWTLSEQREHLEDVFKELTK